MSEMSVGAVKSDAGHAPVSLLCTNQNVPIIQKSSSTVFVSSCTAACCRKRLVVISPKCNSPKEFNREKSFFVATRRKSSITIRPRTHTNHIHCKTILPTHNINDQFILTSCSLRRKSPPLPASFGSAFSLRRMLQARFQRALASLAEWRFAPRSCAAWRILIKSGDWVILAGYGSGMG